MRAVENSAKANVWSPFSPAFFPLPRFLIQQRLPNTEGTKKKKKSKNNNRNVTELLFSFPKGKTNGAECFFPVFCIFVVGVCIRGETLISVFSAKKRKLKGKTIDVRACMLCCSRYSLLPFPFSIVADTMTREKQFFFFFYYELSYMNIHRTNCIDRGSLAYRYTHSRRHINSENALFFFRSSC